MATATKKKAAPKKAAPKKAIPPRPRKPTDQPSVKRTDTVWVQEALATDIEALDRLIAARSAEGGLTTEEEAIRNRLQELADRLG